MYLFYFIFLKSQFSQSIRQYWLKLVVGGIIALDYSAVITIGKRERKARGKINFLRRNESYEQDDEEKNIGK